MMMSLSLKKMLGFIKHNCVTHCRLFWVRKQFLVLETAKTVAIIQTTMVFLHPSEYAWECYQQLGICIKHDSRDSIEHTVFAKAEEVTLLAELKLG